MVTFSPRDWVMRGLTSNSKSSGFTFPFSPKPLMRKTIILLLMSIYGAASPKASSCDKKESIRIWIAARYSLSIGAGTSEDFFLRTEASFSLMPSSFQRVNTLPIVIHFHPKKICRSTCHL
jgi:hypothetical protein